MDIQEVKIAELIGAVYNPRKLSDKEREDLKESLTRFGIVDPIIVNSNKKRKNIIIGGHQRVKVWSEMGNETIPVTYIDLDEPQERELNLRLNKNTGSWDVEALLNEFSSDELKDWGWSDEEYQSLEDALSEALGGGDGDNPKDDNFDPEPPEEPITTPGRVYKLGNHRLMCGDSTSEEQVALLMDSEKADACVTDPPYNVAYEGKTADALTIENDEMNDGEFYDFLLRAHKRMAESVRPGGALYVFHADSEGINFRTAFKESGFLLKQCCIWVKQTMVMGRQDFHWQHEPVLYGWLAGAGHTWCTDRKQTTVWNFDRPMRNAEHPTMKPIELIAYPIECSTKKGQIVLDLFGGSGSTLIACEQTKRCCRMMELDPRYCDVIVNRYCKLTDQDPEEVFKTGVAK